MAQGRPLSLHSHFLRQVQGGSLGLRLRRKHSASNNRDSHRTSRVSKRQLREVMSFIPHLCQVFQLPRLIQKPLLSENN